jgi:predicted Zn-dependent protease
MSGTRASRVCLSIAALVLLAACAARAPEDGGGARRTTADSHYLRYVAFVMPPRKGTVMRWQTSKMPLRVHLPDPPADEFEDPAEVLDAVRRGILDWTDVAAPGVPSFRFVEAGEPVDIPVVWADVAHGWWVAFAAYDLTADSKIFRVNRILVAAKYPDGEQASIDDLYLTMLHEMGHALGMLGHSPAPADVMYEKGHWQSGGLTDRDRNTLRMLYSKPIGAPVPGAVRSDW